ncbi:discoidin domain-containing protein [Bacteroidales bacterium OttesenSCG-928-I21]|nr:discoidin domain-containing protein [Bacteroidales bacterium OttesenSCG-928-I21]
MNAQCDATEITPKSNWAVVYYDSEEQTGEGANSGRAIHSIDNNINTFWHSEWKNSQPDYPHEIQLNLGTIHDVAGFSVLSRANNPFGKPKEYKISLSLNGTDWTPQAIGYFKFPNVDQPEQRASVFFSTVKAQYIKLEFLSPWDDNYYVVLAEIDVFEDLNHPATGQNNQLAVFEEIPKRYANDQAFALNANTNSGLPINFEVIAGPATVNGNIMTLTGEGGTVTIKAYQEGNENYYAWEDTQSFEVVDLNTIQPTINVRFCENIDIQMEELNPYLLYVHTSINESESLNVTSVDFEIDGEWYEAENISNFFQYWWTPTQFGNNTIKIKATASNGMTKIETYNLNVSNSISDIAATTFDGDVIDMGTIGSQWFYGEYKLPQFVGAYNQIIADFKISCPNVTGGCDDWDRLGWVEIKAPDGKWIELFRYITPYGVPCGETIDVTDFTSLLQGKVELRMYIETWGTGGWELDLTLEYIKGNSEFKYSQVQEMWHGNFPFGDLNNLQPMNIVTVEFAENVEKAKLRLVTTGHGWGSNNTGNAAEFYHAYHKIQVNQVDAFEQDLWQNCNPNPAGCTRQQGTWQYDRAGWCPGSMGKLYSYDLTHYIQEKAIELGYKFQESYIDYCHSNNPECISGTTCPNCDDGYNPNYQIGGYVIQYSNLPFTLKTKEQEQLKELSATLYPNPTSESFKIKMDNNWKNITVNIYDISGKLIKQRYLKNTDELNNFTFSIKTLKSGAYFIKLTSDGQFVNTTIIKN